MKIEITVFEPPTKDDWHQGKYHVSGVGDILWTDKIDEVIDFIRNNLIELDN